MPSGRLGWILRQADEGAGHDQPAEVMRHRAVGKRSAAWAHFQQTLLLPDRMMSHHLGRLVMAGAFIGLPEYPAEAPAGH